MQSYSIIPNPNPSFKSIKTSNLTSQPFPFPIPPKAQTSPFSTHTLAISNSPHSLAPTSQPATLPQPHELQHTNHLPLLLLHQHPHHRRLPRRFHRHPRQ